MNLPEQIRTAGIRAVQSCWDDRANITRNKAVGNVIETEEVCGDILCHLSQSSAPALSQTGTAAMTTAVFKLFAATDTDIQLGDTVTVRHKGQIFTGTAGEPFRRDFSVAVVLEAVKIS